MATTNHLSPEHSASLVASGISPEAIAARGYRSVVDPKELLALGFAKSQAIPGLLIPLHSVTGDGAGYHLKPKSPRWKNGNPVKYETPAGSKNRLDCPPGVRDMVQDPNAPLWITEGVKKADSAATRGLCCIALTGVWNFTTKSSDGISEVLEDFDDIPLGGRTVYVVFDSDAVTNKSVKQAEANLCGVLQQRGAVASVLRIPAGADGTKVGLDDYLAAGWEPEALIASATTPTPAREDKTGAARVLGLFKSSGGKLWLGSDGAGYASFAGRTVNCNSRDLRRYCGRLYFKETGKALSDSALDPALSTLDAEAVYASPVRPVFLRVGYLDDTVYLALHDEDGRVVAVTRDGWKVIPFDECPVLFVRTAIMHALPLPDEGGSLDELGEFVNACQEDWPLVKAFVIACFLPWGTFPVFVGKGEQGSGKTFGMARITEIVDPSEACSRQRPAEKDVMAALGSSFVLAFDNLTSLSGRLSDMFCSIASGTSLSTRTLHTTADETTMKVRRPIMMNGVTDIIDRPDLMDRALFVHFRPGVETKRNSEREILRRYEAARARILGGALDAVSRALGSWQEVELPGNPRLYDMAQWLLASCSSEEERRALSFALLENRENLTAVAVDQDDFLAKVVEYLLSHGEFRGSASELLSRLWQDDTKRMPFGWPKDAPRAGSRLAQIAPVLRELGFEAKRERTGAKRAWVIKPVTARNDADDSAVVSQSLDFERNDGHDSNAPIIEFA